MSLKAFHIVFIIASLLLCLGFAAWAFDNYFESGRAPIDLIYGVSSVVAAIGLLFYGKYFLRKLKHISYL
jgi:hypothetical protein